MGVCELMYVQEGRFPQSVFCCAVKQLEMNKGVVLYDWGKLAGWCQLASDQPEDETVGKCKHFKHVHIVLVTVLRNIMHIISQTPFGFFLQVSQI